MIKFSPVFLVMVLAPFVLILAGAGLAALGFTTGWTILLWPGLITAGCGIPHEAKSGS